MDSENLSLPQLEKQLTARTEEAEELQEAVRQVKGRLDTAEVMVHDMKDRLTLAQNTFVELKALVDAVQLRLDKLVGREPEVQRPLRQFILTVLNNSNEPLTVSEIAEMVLEAGYKTTANATNFKSMIQQTLNNGDEFKRASKGKSRPIRYEVN